MCPRRDGWLTLAGPQSGGPLLTQSAKTKPVSIQHILKTTLASFLSCTQRATSSHALVFRRPPAVSNREFKSSGIITTTTACIVPRHHPQNKRGYDCSTFARWHHRLSFPPSNSIISDAYLFPPLLTSLRCQNQTGKKGKKTLEGMDSKLF